MRQPSSAIVDFISSWEGYEPHWYLDGGGVKTIGYGVTARGLRGAGIDPDDIDVPLGRSVAKDLLHRLLNEIYAPAVAKSLDVDVLRCEYDALVSLAYNVGTAAIARSTLIEKINAGAPEAEIEKQWMRWVHDNGEVVRGLVRRRRAELEWYIGLPKRARAYGYERVDVSEIQPADPAEIETLETTDLPYA